MTIIVEYEKGMCEFLTQEGETYCLSECLISEKQEQEKDPDFECNPFAHWYYYYVCR